VTPDGRTHTVTGGVQTHLPPEASTALLRAADARAWRGTLPTLLFCDTGYLEVLLNWLVAADRYGHGDPIICALDDALHDRLDAAGFTSVRVPWDGTLATLWLLRMKAVEVLVDHGYHVLHTDADAVWIDDPMPEVDALDDCDLVASQDAVGPPDALVTMGVVVSSGFFVVRAGAATCGLIGDVVAQLRQGAPDDQTAFNRALVARGMLWDLSDPWDAVTVDDRRVPIFDRTVRGSDHSGLRAALLAQTRYQRVRLDRPAVVAHHLTFTGAGVTRAQLAASGCLYLRHDWRDVTILRAGLQRLATTSDPAITAE
jgi:Nucleotide-diphospho-sugar transferase